MVAKRSISFQAEAWDILQYLFEVKKINDHTLHFAAEFSGKIDVEKLKTAVNISADVFPLIVCRFTESEGRPFWRDGGYTADEIVTCSVTDKTEKSVNDFICTRVEAFNGPQVKIRVIRNGNNDTLVVLMNHMLCDAAGFKDYLYLLSDIYSNLEENPDYCPDTFGSRRICQLLKSFSVHDKMKILFSKNNMCIHDPTAFELIGDPETPFIEQRKIPHDMFCSLKKYVNQHDATVNDLFLSAYIRSLYKIFGHAVVIPCTVDLRKYLPSRKAEGICNLCTNLSCDIGQEIGQAFDQTLDKVKRAMDQEKASTSCLKSITLLEKVFDTLPYKTAKKIVDKSFSNAPIAFTNIGVLDKSRLTFGRAKINQAYMTGSIKYAPYFQLAVSTFDDQATLSVNLYGAQSDRNKVSRFLDGIVHELQSAV